MSQQDEKWKQTFNFDKFVKDLEKREHQPPHTNNPQHPGHHPDHHRHRNPNRIRDSRNREFVRNRIVWRKK